MPMKDVEEASAVLDRIGKQDDIYSPSDEYLAGVVHTLTWIYGSKPNFFKPLPLPKGWPWDDTEVTVGGQIRKALSFLSNAYESLEDISTAEAEEHHEDTRGVLLSVLSGIRSLGEGLTKLQQKAGE